MPALNDLATGLYDLDTTFDEVVHFVHVYVIEPHPLEPDPSPYGGVPWEAAYTERAQPKTYGERVGLATEIRALLEGDQLMLVDELTPEGRNNPLWCSYGPAPTLGYLIDQDGSVVKGLNWNNVREFTGAIKDLLGD